MKYFLLAFSLFLLVSCKDGEIEVPEFTFENTVYTCGNYTLHRRNAANTKALILNLQTADLPNTAGTTDLPNAGRTVLYRVFDGTISSSYFCAAVPPTTPQVVEEWQGSNFSITIETTEDASTTPSTYQHTITLHDLLLTNGTEQEIFETFYFGVVTTN